MIPEIVVPKAFTHSHYSFWSGEHKDKQMTCIFLLIKVHCKQWRHNYKHPEGCDFYCTLYTYAIPTLQISWFLWALCLISGEYPTFFIWNFIVERTSSTFCTMLSLCVSAVGNLPALFRPGPRIRGICLIRLSEARKASYFLARKEEWCKCMVLH